jgi:hypothetical protein
MLKLVRQTGNSIPPGRKSTYFTYLIMTKKLFLCLVFVF